MATDEPVKWNYRTAPELWIPVSTFRSAIRFVAVHVAIALAAGTTDPTRASYLKDSDFRTEPGYVSSSNGPSRAVERRFGRK